MAEAVLVGLSYAPCKTDCGPMRLVWLIPCLRRTEVHIAAVSDANPARPFGAWYLDYQLQETFTKPGLYVVRLAATRQPGQGPGQPTSERLEQVRPVTQRMHDAWQQQGALFAHQDTCAFCAGLLLLIVFHRPG